MSQRAATCDNKRSTAPINSGPATFPEILMSILDNENAYGHAITWLPGGKSFVFRSPKAFTVEVLPNFFRRPVKFSSFVRKLYFWGFKKIANTSIPAFYHPNFLRGSRPSCMHLREIERKERATQKQKQQSPQENTNHGNTVSSGMFARKLSPLYGMSKDGGDKSSSKEVLDREQKKEHDHRGIPIVRFSCHDRKKTLLCEESIIDRHTKKVPDALDVASLLPDTDLAHGLASHINTASSHSPLRNRLLLYDDQTPTLPFPNHPLGSSLHIHGSMSEGLKRCANAGQVLCYEGAFVPSLLHAHLPHPIYGSQYLQQRVVQTTRKQELVFAKIKQQAQFLRY